MVQFFFHLYYFNFFSSHELILLLVYYDEFPKTQIRLGLLRKESIFQKPFADNGAHVHSDKAHLLSLWNMFLSIIHSYFITKFDDYLRVRHKFVCHVWKRNLQDGRGTVYDKAHLPSLWNVFLSIIHSYFITKFDDYLRVRHKFVCHVWKRDLQDGRGTV